MSVKFGTFPQLAHFILISLRKALKLKKCQKIEVWGRQGRVINNLAYNPGHKYLEQSKEIKQNWTGAESINTCFCTIFLITIAKVLFLQDLSCSGTHLMT